MLNKPAGSSGRISDTFENESDVSLSNSSTVGKSPQGIKFHQNQISQPSSYQPFISFYYQLSTSMYYSTIHEKKGKTKQIHMKIKTRKLPSIFKESYQVSLFMNGKV